MKLGRVALVVCLVGGAVGGAAVHVRGSEKARPEGAGLAVPTEAWGGAQPETSPAGAEAQPAEPEGQPDAKPDVKPDAKPGGKEEPPKYDAGTFSALSARSLGPALLSGRVGDIAVNPMKRSEFYVAACSGGVWKTTNGGLSFRPVFDGYGSFSIGCLALDPGDASTVWVGTGENNSQRSVSWGDGVYVSRDAGKSFRNVGLPQSGHIGMIAIDPRDSDVVYVAAMGPLWSSGGERGLYKTTNGGAAWSRVLHISEDTGINEVHLDPGDPDTLYATAYQRRRHVWTLIDGGPESSIYKSTDAGRSWKKIDSGLPGVDKGRIGMAVSRAEGGPLYAIVEAADGQGGVFRSVDRGATWEKRSGYMTTSPQYYNELFTDPRDPDRVYAADTFLAVSDDGGANFRRLPITDMHVDFHAMWIDPDNTDHLLVGNDGGLYETFDRASWRHFENLPITQFYRVAVDNSLPFYYVYGGTQDNNTQGGPSRTTDRAGITNADWFVTVGGDGFQVAVDPEDPNTVYCEWQDGGLTRYDRASGEEVDIRPREKEGDPAFVFNWDTPLMISPHRRTRLYAAGNFLFRSEDRGDTWTRISEDLSRGLDRNQLKVMGKIQKPDAVAKHRSTSIFGSAVALAESPLVEGLLYAGSDDGLIHISEDGGTTWRKVENFPVVPEMSYVSDLEASNHSAEVVYATFDNHKMGDFAPYILRSDDRGRSWKPVAGDLPARDTVYTIVEDPVNADLLFAGTEYGAYFTLDGGKRWLKIRGLPTIAVRDLVIQRRESDLVMATFGRGFYILDDYSMLRTFAPEVLREQATIFPIKRALAYVERSRLGGTYGRGWSGTDYFAAKNPPAGAVVTYYLKEKPLSRREQRKEAEKKEDWKYPTLEQFQAEDRELPPVVVLTIRDADGSVVRRLDVPKEKGMHRVAWNLRFPEPGPASLARGELAPWDLVTSGTLAPPGRYTAQLSKIVDGVAEDLTPQQPFEVVDLNVASGAATGEKRLEKFQLERDLAGLQRAVQGAVRLADEASSRLTLLRKAAADTPGLDADVFKDLESLRARLQDLRIELRGDPTYDDRMVPEGPSIAGRVGSALGNLLGTTQVPPTTAREQFDLAAREFETLLPKLRQLDQDLGAFEARLEAAGSPWTPGRVPDWKRR